MQEDLIQLGYNEGFTIVGPKVAQQVESHPGHGQNMFRIFQRKIAKKYEDGSKVVRISFLEEHQIPYGDLSGESIEVQAETVSAENTQAPAQTQQVEQQQAPDPTPDSEPQASAPSHITCAITGEEFPNDTSQINMSNDGRMISKEAQGAIWAERAGKLENAGFQKTEDGTCWENAEGTFTSDEIDLGLCTELEFKNFFSNIRAKSSLANKPPSGEMAGTGTMHLRKVEDDQEATAEEPAAEELPEHSEPEQTEDVDIAEQHKQILKDKGFYNAGPTWNFKENPTMKLKSVVVGSDDFDTELEKVMCKIEGKPVPKKEAPKKEEKPQPKEQPKTETKTEASEPEVDETETEKEETVDNSVDKNAEAQEIQVPAVALPDENRPLEGNGFFSSLMSFAFDTVNLKITNVGDGNVLVSIAPENNSDDPALDNLPALTLKASYEEMDAKFFDEIRKPMDTVAGICLNAKQFVLQAKAKEEATKAAKARQESIKSGIDAAKKYQDDDKRDWTKKRTITTAKGKWDYVIGLDPENKEAKEALKALEEKAKEIGSTLF